MTIYADGSTAYITPDDLAPFATIDEAKALAMIEDALAKAARVAPCLNETEFQADEMNVAAVRAVLRTAILRRNDAGSGAFQQQTAGAFSVSHDTRQPHRALFWPSEIDELQAICRTYNGEGRAGAFEVNTIPEAARDGYWSAPDTWTTL